MTTAARASVDRPPVEGGRPSGAVRSHGDGLRPGAELGRAGLNGGLDLWPTRRPTGWP